MNKKKKNKKKKALLEIRGNNFEIICLVVQAVSLIVSIALAIYCNFKGIGDGFLPKMTNFTLYLAIALGIVPLMVKHTI